MQIFIKNSYEDTIIGSRASSALKDRQCSFDRTSDALREDGIRWEDYPKKLIFVKKKLNNNLSGYFNIAFKKFASVNRYHESSNSNKEIVKLREK